MSAFLLLLFTLPFLQAQTFTALYNFTGGSDGGLPMDRLTLDKKTGTLYGTAEGGGPAGFGAVFSVTSAGTETVLYSFTSSAGCPYASLLRDGKGNLYGTTGSEYCGGIGTVFKLAPSGNLTTLYSFSGGWDGCSPEQGLVADKSGNVFGAANSCGPYNWGTIFKVDSTGNFTRLHSFTGQATGARPEFGQMVMDKSGTLYGTTSIGGTSKHCGRDGCGALYQLTPTGELTVLHSFAGGNSDGCTPYGSVVQDKAGNLYGTTSACGLNNAGTIWKVSKTGKETILHSFSNSPSDGCYPSAGVIRDAAGNL